MSGVYFACSWIACGICAAGLFFAHFQGRWPTLAQKDYRIDLGHALLMGLAGGPIAFVIALFTTGFGEHGWRLK